LFDCFSKKTKIYFEKNETLIGLNNPVRERKFYISVTFNLILIFLVARARRSKLPFLFISPLHPKKLRPVSFFRVKKVYKKCQKRKLSLHLFLKEVLFPAKVSSLTPCFASMLPPPTSPPVPVRL